MRALRASALLVVATAACNDPSNSGFSASASDSAAGQSTGGATADSDPTTADPTTAEPTVTGDPTTDAPTVTGDPTSNDTTTAASTGSTTDTASASDSDASTGVSCPEGQQGCPCGQGDTCDGDLQCVQDLCQPPPPPTCGDGVLDPGEQCDAGEDNSDTGACKTNCTAAECGDGFVGPGEQCDQGAMNSDTGACKTDCTPATCGDGFVGPGEQCDDGNLVDGDACGNDCAPASCGDGKPGPGEQCDDGNQTDTDACTNACAAATCGDGIVHAGVEQCDAGAMNSDTGACTLACKTAACGDGHVQAGVEQCDDANQVDTDACTAGCKTAKCGDGIVQAGVEQCDQGANNSNTGACTLACKTAKCGDGFVQPGEQCDDANQTNGDGCENTCKLTPQNAVDDCGFPADDGVWFEIDYSNAFSVTNPSWKYSPTPGWGEADWAPQGETWPEVWNVFNNATIHNDQIGKVALLDGSNKAIQVMFGIGGLSYDYATVCVQGRSYSVGSSVTFTAQNQLNKCGGTGMLANSWQVHKAGVDIGGCIVDNNEFQGLRVWPSGGSSALSLKKLRLTLHGAVY